MLRHPQKVLIVEDNAALAAVVEFNLLKAGFDVVRASNGLRAWEEFQQADFDLMITDQQMPHMTGLELCRKIRSESRNRSIPIVLLTAKSMELQKEDFMDELQLLQVVSKPFSPAFIVSLAQQGMNASL